MLGQSRASTLARCPWTPLNGKSVQAPVLCTELFFLLHQWGKRENTRPKAAFFVELFEHLAARLHLAGSFLLHVYAHAHVPSSSLPLDSTTACTLVTSRFGADLCERFCRRRRLGGVRLLRAQRCTARHRGNVAAAHSVKFGHLCCPQGITDFFYNDGHKDRPGRPYELASAT